MEDVKPFGGALHTDSGPLSNPAALPLLPPLHSPLNLSGSHSGPGGGVLHSPLDLSRNPSHSEPCSATLGAASLAHQPSGLMQQSSFTSQQQLQAMAQACARPRATPLGTAACRGLVGALPLLREAWQWLATSACPECDSLSFRLAQVTVM